MTESPENRTRNRITRNLGQFVTFGLIGGSGVVVNMVVVVLCNNIGTHLFSTHDYDRPITFPGTDLGIRNYLIYAVVAFFAANLYNFVLNRHLTFRTGTKAPFFKEFVPFLLVGSVAQLLGLVILLALRNPQSPLYLSSDFFVDDSPFWRRRLYWAQMIQIVLVMPINFVVNKLWTFRAVRNRHAARTEAAAEPPTGGPGD